MRVTRRTAGLLLCALLLVAGSAAAKGPQAQHINGIAVTGFNRLLGEPIWDFPGTLGMVGFNSFGAFNPNGNRALPLTPDSPPSTLLATAFDPFFLFPGTSEEDVASELNIPLRQVGVVVDSAGLVRAPLPDHLSVGQLVRSQVSPSDAITLGDWLEAEGSGVINCGGQNGTATVNLIMDGLIPYGLYSVWAIFGPNGVMTALPLGGTPNVFVADGRGRATFERTINFCPLDLAPGQTPLLHIDVLWHSDHRVAGTRPNLPRAKLFEGTVTHTHLEFLVSGGVPLP